MAHVPQASVSLIFLPHFDVFCDLITEQTHGNIESIVLYNDQKRIRPIHLRVAWDQALHWGKYDKKNWRGHKKSDE